MPHPLPPPAASTRDDDAVELVRAWVAERGLNFSLKLGLYADSETVSEPEAWGVILADMARHIAVGLEQQEGTDSSEALRQIRNAFLNEFRRGEGHMTGGFVEGANGASGSD